MDKKENVNLQKNWQVGFSLLWKCFIFLAIIAVFCYSLLRLDVTEQEI